MIEKVIDIRHPLYRGQLLRSEPVKINGADGIFYEKQSKELIAERYRYFMDYVYKDEDKIFMHEYIALCELLEHNRNIYMNTPYLPHVYEFIAKTAAIYALAKGSNVLVIYPDRLDGDRLKKQFEKFKNLNIVDIKEKLGQKIDLTSHVIYADPEGLLEMIEKYRDELSEWINVLGLIIVHDVTGYNIAEMMHVKEIIKVLQTLIEARKERLPLFMMTGEKLLNQFNFIAGMFPHVKENDVKIIEPTTQKSTVYLYYWVPPYIIDEQNLIRRDDFYKELKVLIKLLKDTKKILVWYGFAKITKDKIIQIARELPEDKEIRIIREMKEVDEDEFYSFDAIILLGVPRNIRTAIEMCSMLAKSDGKVIFILPQEAVSYYFMKSMRPLQDYDYQDIIIPEATDTIRQAYFIQCLKINGRKVYSEKEWNSLQEKFNVKVDGHMIEQQNDTIIIREMPAIKLRTSCMSKNYLKVKLPAGKYIYLDGEMIPEKYFDGSIYEIDDILYELNIKNDVEGEMNQITNVVERIPLIDVNAKMPDESKKEFNYGGISIKYFEDVKLTLKYTGYKEYIDYNVKPKLIHVRGKKYDKVRNCIVIEVPKEVTHTMTHMMRYALTLYYKNVDEILQIMCADGKILIYSPFEEVDIENLLTPIRYITMDIMAKLSMELMLELCPCKEGCIYCTDALHCNKKEKVANKKESLEFVINSMSQRITHDIRNRFKVKYGEKLSVDDAWNVFSEIRNRVIKVFENKLNLHVSKWVPLIVVTKEKMAEKAPKAAGIYTGKEVWILSTLDEASAYEVMAHEYGHQIIGKEEYNIHESLVGKSIPFNGKLFIEGAAEWLAFKLMDHFDVRRGEPVDNLVEFSEYGEGFLLMCWLEDKVGMFGVLEFLKNGEIKIGDKTYGPEDIIRESGLEAKILQKEHMLQ